MGEEIINAKHIDKSFEGRTVLNDLDLIVNKGDLIAIMGKSGSGKSTLLHILGTLDAADQGELMIAGQNPAKMTKNQLSDFRNQRIGFVFQFHHLLSAFTAIENVMMPLKIRGIADSKLQARAQELLRKVGLEDYGHRYPTQLSGGQQQRVAIVRALMAQPALVLADEPTGNLDSQTADSIFNLLRQINQEDGTAFLIVTHDVHLASRCDRQITLKDGALISDTYNPLS